MKNIWKFVLLALNIVRSKLIFANTLTELIFNVN